MHIRAERRVEPRLQDHELQVGKGNAVLDQPEDIDAVPQWALDSEL